MKLIIDDANVEAIKALYEYFPVDGVTTNPSILAKSGRNPYDVLSEIREIIGADAELHVQVISKKAEGMVAEAAKIILTADTPAPAVTTDTVTQTSITPEPIAIFSIAFSKESS